MDYENLWFGLKDGLSAAVGMFESVRGSLSADVIDITINAFDSIKQTMEDMENGTITADEAE
jgi:hypothetical protein